MIDTCDAASFKRINTARIHVTKLRDGLGTKDLAREPSGLCLRHDSAEVGLSIRRLKVTQSCFNELC